jgi:hypothetical protein
MSVTTSLFTLPVDVLLVIRDVISSAPFTSADPGLGLLAHLSLSQTCRRLRDIYTFSTRESDDLFWKRACAMAGYGRPMRREYPQALPGSTIHDTPTPEVFTWKQIALIVTAHTRVCEIRSCRNASCWPGTLRFPHPFTPVSLPPLFRGNLSPSHATHSHPPYTYFWNKPFILFTTQMTWTRDPRRSRSTRCSITSTSQLARSSIPPTCCTRCSRPIRIAVERFMRRSVATRALRAHL